MIGPLQHLHQPSPNPLHIVYHVTHKTNKKMNDSFPTFLLSSFLLHFFKGLSFSRERIIGVCVPHEISHAPRVCVQAVNSKSLVQGRFGIVPDCYSRKIRRKRVWMICFATRTPYSMNRVVSDTFCSQCLGKRASIFLSNCSWSTFSPAPPWYIGVFRMSITRLSRTTERKGCERSSLLKYRFWSVKSRWGAGERAQCRDQKSVGL